LTSTPDTEALDFENDWLEAIAAKADFEYLYDKPYENRKKVRVAGPFTVESLSPHRVLGVGADDELLDPQKRVKGEERGVKGGESAAFG
jgi:adenine-specific DNA-methyltransferase